MAAPIRSYLDFEKPVAELEAKVRGIARARGERRRRRDRRGDRPVSRARRKKRSPISMPSLTPWQKTQVARHPQRPHCLDYVAGLMTDFTPLAGDRKFGEDEAIIGGFGRFRGDAVCVIGHEKGSDTESRAQAQFRHGAAGGLPQGGAADGAGRRFDLPVHRAGRYRRRLSRHRRRGARPGRGHRPLDRSLSRARRAQHRGRSSARAARAAPSRSPPPTAC